MLQGIGSQGQWQARLAAARSGLTAAPASITDWPRTCSHSFASTSGRATAPVILARRLTRGRGLLQVTAALFEPPPFKPSKLSVRFLPGATAHGPAPPAPRRYTLTHNDLTGALQLSIGRQYNAQQVHGFYTRLLRDEIIAEWVFGSNSSCICPAEAETGLNSTSIGMRQALLPAQQAQQQARDQADGGGTEGNGSSSHGNGAVSALRNAMAYSTVSSDSSSSSSNGSTSRTLHSPSYSSSGNGSSSCSSTTSSSSDSSNSSSSDSSNSSSSGPVLHVYCHVSGEELWLAPPQLRNYIFRREMTLVLDTLLYADRALLAANPLLLSAPVIIHFHSHVESLNITEGWGTLGDRSSWQRMPGGLVERLRLLLYGFPTAAAAVEEASAAAAAAPPAAASAAAATALAAPAAPAAAAVPAAPESGQGAAALSAALPAAGGLTSAPPQAAYSASVNSSGPANAVSTPAGAGAGASAAGSGSPAGSPASGTAAAGASSGVEPQLLVLSTAPGADFSSLSSLAVSGEPAEALLGSAAVATTTTAAVAAATAAARTAGVVGLSEAAAASDEVAELGGRVGAEPVPSWRPEPAVVVAASAGGRGRRNGS